MCMYIKVRESSAKIAKLTKSLSIFFNNQEYVYNCIVCNSNKPNEILPKTDSFQP